LVPAASSLLGGLMSCRGFLLRFMLPNGITGGGGGAAQLAQSPQNMNSGW